jgi:hypothetical protein
VKIRVSRSVGLAAALSSLLAAPLALADGDGPQPELALQFDFYSVEGAGVPDGSGRGHDGTLLAGEIVPGRDKPAVKFAGAGLVTATGMAAAELVAQPLTVGAMCRPEAKDGVVVAMGGGQDGFSLYLEDGVPRFAVRAAGVVRVVSAPEPVVEGQWVHLAGVVDAKGALTLLVDTWPVARAPGLLLRATPAEPLTVGADPGSFVGEYASPMHWTGLLQDVRLYRGVVSRDATRELLGEWAHRPGCGCRK